MKRANNLGKVEYIREVKNVSIANNPTAVGTKGARLGLAAMLGYLGGGLSYDGYEVKTEKHSFWILIDNGQSCCEDWGYLVSDDDVAQFEGKTLVDVELTDIALNTKQVEEFVGYLDEGGIQFVNFKFSNGGCLQIAVYNAHNGYYGHDIIIARDTDALKIDTL